MITHLTITDESMTYFMGAAAKLADGGNSDVNEPMLPEDLFTDQTATLLNPVCNVGIDERSGQECLHNRLFVGVDRGGIGAFGEGAETAP